MTSNTKKFVIAFGLLLLFVLINTFINSRREARMEFNFKISKIHVTPTSSIELYDRNGVKTAFWNYHLMNNEGVVPGDSVFKEPCAEKLYIYKNVKGKYQLYKILTPDGMFQFSWFCN